METEGSRLKKERGTPGHPSSDSKEERNGRGNCFSYAAHHPVRFASTPPPIRRGDFVLCLARDVFFGASRRGRRVSTLASSWRRSSPYQLRDLTMNGGAWRPEIPARSGLTALEHF
jgi:hypothetical protein